MSIPDYRRVFKEGGRWHMGRTGRINDESLCDYCGTYEGSELCALAMVSSREEVGLRVTHCPNLVPIIGFNIGVCWMEKDQEWNTIRLGSLWGTRVEPGSFVRLVDTNDEANYMMGEVTRVHVGEKSSILAKHSKRNHLGMGLPSKGRPKMMAGLLRRIYGTRFYEHAQNLTAIYVRVL